MFFIHRFSNGTKVINKGYLELFSLPNVHYAKIYGVYCYDTNSITPLFRREVSYQELYKFNNVTGLVRANKGLFLPYSDLYKRNTTTAALGTYMATQLSQKGKFNSYYYFFFGYEYESNWMLTDDNNADKRIAAIRPVYVTPTKP